MKSRRESTKLSVSLAFHFFDRSEQVGEKSLADLGVWITESEAVASLIVRLDCQVSGVIACESQIVAQHIAGFQYGSGYGGSFQIRSSPVVLQKLFYKTCRSAGLEPVVADIQKVQGFDDAERIVDIGKVLREMIAVILYLELLQCFFGRPSPLLSQIFDSLLEIVLQFLGGDSADGGISRVERDVGYVVQSAEDVDLAQFAHACEEDELQAVGVGFHHAVEVMQSLAVGGHKLRMVRHVHHRTVVLVDQHHHLLAGLLENISYQLVETPVRSF